MRPGERALGLELSVESVSSLSSFPIGHSDQHVVILPTCMLRAQSHMEIKTGSVELANTSECLIWYMVRSLKESYRPITLASKASPSLTHHMPEARAMFHVDGISTWPAQTPGLPKHCLFSDEQRTTTRQAGQSSWQRLLWGLERLLPVFCLARGLGHPHRYLNWSGNSCNLSRCDPGHTRIDRTRTMNKIRPETHDAKIYSRTRDNQ